MKVIGFDISTVATGWCLTEDGKYIKSGVIRPIDGLAAAKGITKKAAGELLSSELAKFIYTVPACRQIIYTESPDFVVVEDAFMKMNASVLRLLARLSGGVLCEWMNYWLSDPRKVDPQTRTFIVMASRARARVGCKGNATKNEVKAFVQYRYGITIQDDNEADAFVLSMYGYLQANAPQEPKEPKPRKRRRSQ